MELGPSQLFHLHSNAPEPAWLITLAVLGAASGMVVSRLAARAAAARGARRASVHASRAFGIAAVGGAAAVLVPHVRFGLGLRAGTLSALMVVMLGLAIVDQATARIPTAGTLLSGVASLGVVSATCAAADGVAPGVRAMIAGAVVAVAPPRASGRHLRIGRGDIRLLAATLPAVASLGIRPAVFTAAMSLAVPSLLPAPVSAVGIPITWEGARPLAPFIFTLTLLSVAVVRFS